MTAAIGSEFGEITNTSMVVSDPTDPFLQRENPFMPQSRPPTGGPATSLPNALDQLNLFFLQLNQE